jgi:hypothetical protein
MVGTIKYSGGLYCDPVSDAFVMYHLPDSLCSWQLGKTGYLIRVGALST